jgi:endonuclease-3 related protein
MPSFHESFPAVLEAIADRAATPTMSLDRLEPFETLLVILLEKELNPKKALVALETLREEGLSTPRELAASDPAEVAEVLRSSGVSASEKSLGTPLRVARWLRDNYDGSVESLADPESPISTEQLREKLTAINGVGPATADALLLFGLNRPAYPVDRATYRILVRHGWLDPTADYDEARASVEDQSPDDPSTLARLSRAFASIGREFCRAAAPRCDRCPLSPFLPDGGPLDPT